MVEVPEKLRSFIIKRVQKQDWYYGLDRTIISARMKTMADEYIIKGVMLSVAVGIAGILASYIFYTFQTGLTTIPDILTAARLGGLSSEYAVKVFRTLIVYIVMALVPIISFYVSLTFTTAYPAMKANERGKMIDEKMSVFASHMAIMLQNNAHLLDAFGYIEKSKLYGEIGEEIGIILKRASFNINFIDAINHVASTTSSYELRKYLNGIVETTLNMGTLDTYLRNASESLNRLSSIKAKESVHGKAALVEVYTIAMVMMPLMVLLTLMTTALMGEEVTMGDVVVYGYIPLGTIVFLLMAERGIKIEVKPEEKTTAKEKRKNKDKEGFKEKVKVKDYLNTEDGRLVVGSISGMPIAYLIMLGGLGIDTTLLVFFIIMILPYGLYWRDEAKRLRKEEEAMTVFLRNVADRHRMGYGIIEIFEPTPVYEHINKRVEKIYQSLKMGENLETAIDILKDKRSFVMTRASVIINDALRCGGHISKVLESVGEDIQNHFNIYREIEGDMKMNTKMIIATYFLFVAIVWIINNMFFKSFTGTGVSIPLDMEYYKRLFYHGSALTGISAGLVMGRYEQGDPRPGLVFSAIFALITVIAFGYI